MKADHELATPGAGAAYGRLLFSGVVLAHSFFVLLCFCLFARRRRAAERTAWCLALPKKLDHGLILKHACCPHLGGTYRMGWTIGRCGVEGQSRWRSLGTKELLLISLRRTTCWE